MSKESIQTKLVFLGEAAVGKSSIVLRFIKDEFNQNCESTIGAAFLTAQVDINERYTIKYEIWDTAGQERFHSLAPMYYRGAQAAIVVYDITNISSFERAKNWVSELLVEGTPEVIIALAGNKLDMASERKVQISDAKAYAERGGLIFMECSAKTGENVREIFNAIANRIPRIKGSITKPVNPNIVTPTADLRQPRQQPPSGGCC